MAPYGACIELEEWTDDNQLHLRRLQELGRDKAPL
jgi:hypothetical protein